MDRVLRDPLGRGGRLSFESHLHHGGESGPLAQRSARRSSVPAHAGDSSLASLPRSGRRGFSAPALGRTGGRLMSRRALSIFLPALTGVLVVMIWYGIHFWLAEEMRFLLPTPGAILGAFQENAEQLTRATIN